MRKYVIGFLVGAALSFGVSAHADDIMSLIGKQVDGQVSVEVNGKELLVPAAIIEGTSYAPVRAIGDAVGLNVDWYEGKVLLNSKEVKPVVDDPVVPEQKVTNPTVEISQINPVHFDKRSVKLDDKQVINQGNYELVELDGEQYANLGALGGPYTIKWDLPSSSSIFEKEGQEVRSIKAADEYSIGVDSFSYRDNVFIKLSLFGLKATVNGDTLIIE